MRAVKGKGTGLERRLWAMLAGMRIGGWRRNKDSITGKPDVVFHAEGIAVFVDGCFWHGCPKCNRKLPETNQGYWISKIERNVERDKKNVAVLSESGWLVIRIWEHELRNDADRAKVRARLREAIIARRTALCLPPCPSCENSVLEYSTNGWSRAPEAAPYPEIP